MSGYDLHIMLVKAVCCVFDLWMYFIQYTVNVELFISGNFRIWTVHVQEFFLMFLILILILVNSFKLDFRVID